MRRTERVVVASGVRVCVAAAPHQWFITIFTYNFPFSVVVRIWDCFLLEGWKVVFRVALGLLKHHEGETCDIAGELPMVWFGLRAICGRLVCALCGVDVDAVSRNVCIWLSCVSSRVATAAV